MRVPRWNSGKARSIAADYSFLAIGLVLFAFIGMRWNATFAPWIGLPFLVRFFRRHEGKAGLAAGYALLLVPSFLKLHGTWGDVVGLGIELAATLFLAYLPFALPLALDRFFHRRVGPFAAGLDLPASYVALDWLMTILVGQGTTGNLAVTQIAFKELIQSASWMGIWGVSFLVLWFASAVNGLAVSAAGSRERRASIAALALIGAFVLAGGIRLAQRQDAPTVKVAGVKEAMPSDYFEILDRGCPESEAASFKPRFAELADRLFEKSAIAAAGGAKIIFWAEGNCFAYEDQVDGIMARARAFAMEEGVYLAPSLQVLSYGSKLNDSRSAMITPAGETAFVNRKHISKYEVVPESDGVIRSVDSPYGRIGTAVCFDMDMPSYIAQIGRRGADIMLVPAYDTKEGAPYHTYPALLRGVENGFSVFRLVNEGTSIAIDPQGRELAALDFFTSRDSIIYADLPTRGAATLYRSLGDWPVAASALILLALAAILFVRKS